jgi:hypothetical protein
VQEGQDELGQEQQQHSDDSNDDSDDDGDDARASRPAARKGVKLRKKLVKVQVNYSQNRTRMVEGVEKFARKLLPQGDMILLLHLPLPQQATMRVFQQNFTREQLSVIADVLLNHKSGRLGWQELRLQKLLRMLKMGE